MPVSSSDYLEFVIPLSKDDIFHCPSSNVNAVTVSEIWPPRVIGDKVFEAKAFCTSNATKQYVDVFDILFSVIYQYSEVDDDTRQMASAIILRCLKNICNDVVDFGNRSTNSESRADLRRTLKMFVYLCCQQLDCLLKLNASNEFTSLPKGRGKSQHKKKLTPNGPSMDVTVEACKALVLFNKLMVSEISCLWDNNVLELEFSNLITGICYKCIGDPILCKDNDIKRDTFAIIGIFVKHYDHSLSASLEISQLLQHYDHLSTTLADAVSTWNHKQLIVDVVREVCNLVVESGGCDGQASRNIGQFIMDLGERVPENLYNCLSIILPLSEEEPYFIRNSVMSLICEIICRRLSKPDISNNDRKCRDKLIDCLEDHIYDVNAFSRSKALQCLNNLSNKRAMPVTRYAKLAELSVDRLRDKSSIVRKSSIILLKSLISWNPFSSKLLLEEMNVNLEKESKILDELLLKEKKFDWAGVSNGLTAAVVQVMDNMADDGEPIIDGHESVPSLVNEIYSKLIESQYVAAVTLVLRAKQIFTESSLFKSDNDNTEEYIFKVCEEIYKTCILKDIDAQPGVDDNAVVTDDDGALIKQKLLVEYLTDSVDFSTHISSSIPIVANILHSKTQTDVIEGIQFFVTVHNFGLKCTDDCLDKMFSLIYSKEPLIVENVSGACRSIYLDVSGSPKSQAFSLFNLLCNPVRQVCAQVMIRDWATSDDIKRPVVQTLWEIYTCQKEQYVLKDRINAITTLGMVASAKPQLMFSNLQLVIDHGFSAGCELATAVCQAMIFAADSLYDCQQKGEEQFILESDHDLWKKTLSLLELKMADSSETCWVNLLTHGVKLIFSICEAADVVAGHFLIRLSEIIVESTEDGDIHLASVDGSLLTRFLYSASHVALCLLVYVDVRVFSELKRRDELKGKLKQSSNKRKTSRTSTSSDVSRRTSCVSTTSAFEDDFSSVPTEDAHSDFIKQICEDELVTSPIAISSQVMVLVLRVCSQPNAYQNSELIASASLSLAKYMLVSSRVCDTHLQLLCTLLDRSPDQFTRANLMICLGDLTVRFPNEVEPWTQHLYARLRDQSSFVRQIAIMVLSHLILNDMIKVKGRISDVAACLVDEDPLMVEKSKLFFSELSHKGNSLYNVLPDIISHLSEADGVSVVAEDLTFETATKPVRLNEVSFQKVLANLLLYVTKDKQCESLVEKLCLRMKSSVTDRQARDIAFCLSQVTLSEKGVKKLLDNFNCYGNKLLDKQVYDCFQIIHAKSRKLQKGDSRGYADELQTKLEQSVERNEKEPVGDVTIVPTLDRSVVAKSTVIRRRTKRRTNVAYEAPADED